MIHQARTEVEKQAKSMLRKGLETLNQSQVGIALLWLLGWYDQRLNFQVGVALQVFHHLGILQSTVESVLESARENLLNNLKKALDVESLSSQLPPTSVSQNAKFKGPGRVSMPITGSSPAFRAALWTNMEKLMDQIFSGCAQVWNLIKYLYANTCKL